MRGSVYLIVNKNGVVAMRKSEYSLKIGEVAIKINLDLPNSLFNSPMLEGSIKLTPEQVKDRVLTELEFTLKRLKAKGERLDGNQKPT